MHRTLSPLSSRFSGHLPFLAITLLFAASIAGGAAYTLERLRSNAIGFHTEVGAMQSRAAEDQLTQSLNVVDLMLANVLSVSKLDASPAGISAHFQAELRHMPLLRSLSLLDEQGRIVASSNPRNLGVRVGQDDYLPPATEPAVVSGFLRFGLPWSGRDFADGYPISAQHPAMDRAPSLIPVIRQVQLRDHQVTVLAAINPDHFINHFSQRLDPTQADTEVLRLDGALLLSTRESASPGQLHRDLALSRAASEVEFGTYEEAEDYGVPVISAFRVSRLFPLVVITHIDRDHALQAWTAERQRLIWLIVPALLAVVALASLTYVRQRRLSHQHALARQQERQRLAALLNTLPANLLLLDSAGQIVMVNAVWVNFLEQTQLKLPEHGVGCDFLELCAQLPGSDGGPGSPLANAIRGLLEQQRGLVDQEYEIALPSGRRRYHLTAHPLREPGMRGTVVMQLDITERKQAEAELQLAASVFTHAREGIAICDANGNFIEVNETFTRITGYGREDVLGHNPRMLQSGRQPGEFYACLWRDLKANGYWTGEIWNRRKDGEVYAEMLTISQVTDASGKPQNYVALFTDITPMKEYARQLEHMAHFDSLTGLPNRVLLADRLQQAVLQSQRRSQPLAVVYLDLDGFKEVNDRHGHVAGDELLVAISKRMKSALREGDTLARMGGDEFVAVLVDLEDNHYCEPVLERLLAAASEPVMIGKVLLQVSASIGVTLYPQDSADAGGLLRHADQAMYLAKQNGKDRYQLFDVAHHAAVQSHHESLREIQRGLDQREFVLHYQPKVNIRRNTVVGVEALIRWQHPKHGLLLPSNFLPSVEAHATGVALGEWVIATALAQMAAWHAVGLDIPMSVNMGAYQLQQQGFAACLSALLAAQPDIQPGCLELEILETSALENLAQVSDVMHACREIGVRFALDDFGTGYSSLTYLKHLPAEVLKIDLSFVQDMLDDPNDLAIVQGIIGLAGAFHREVIAEGVETRAHGALLLSLGCELAQGYGIARPMPAADVPGWVARWKTSPAWLTEPSPTRPPSGA